MQSGAAHARLDFWFELASTYSYPAALRMAATAAAAKVNVRWRVFLLGPIFRAQGIDTSPFNLHPAKGRYMWRDVERVCAQLGLPFRRPEPFPQPSLLAARVALVGLAQAWGVAFVCAVYRAQFGEGRQIGEEAVIGDLLADIGVEPGAVLEEARSPTVKAALHSETAEAERIGIFGAPSFATPDGELFWGNDRLEAALAWVRSRG